MKSVYNAPVFFSLAMYVGSMVRKLDISAYGSLLCVRRAYGFDAGCFLMRLYAYMMNIGTMAMLTLAGYSFLEAGIVSSAIALSTFAIAPRVSKTVDRLGQRKVVPKAAVVALGGLGLLLIAVQLEGPLWLLLVAAVPMGFLPNPQALARSRWTFLIHSGCLGADGPDLRTMFSYEGVLDDVGFMFGPSASIALATAIGPIVGMAVGGLSYAVGVAVLLGSRITEPPAGAGDREGPAPVGHSRERAVIVTEPIVRVLFAVMLFVGAFFSAYDAGTVALAEELCDPFMASAVLMMVSCLSMVTGLLFGMLRLQASAAAQLLGAALLAGGTFGCMFLVDSGLSLFALSAVAALFYAPLLITANAVCERSVPQQRITEAITWINAGMTCGMAFGPSLSGFVIDFWGAPAGFDCCALLAWAVPLTVLVCLPVVRRAAGSDD